MMQSSPAFEKRGRVSDPRLEVCVPELVSQRAAVAPGAIAALYDDVSLTYQELDERAGQMAHHLVRLGVCPGTVVGLCLPRSVAMIIGALGIMKAGAAYLPIDPVYPRQRIESILDDAKVSALVGAQRDVDKLSGGFCQWIGLDSWGGVAGQPSTKPFSCKPKSDDLAYVIYTSGSTGHPKGVEVTHGNLLNLVFWHQAAFRVTAADRASQLASVGFDAAVWELWPYLTAGASINIPTDNLLANPKCLRDWLLEQHITVSFVPTPVAERLLALEWPQKVDLRFLLTGADVLRRYPPDDLPFCLVNNYGPTECTVVAASGVVPPHGRPHCLPTIGRPIANTQVHILDENLCPVPVGAVGEIYIGGAGVARGYRHRPDLTAERFISDPFSSAPGFQLYKTGDRARYTANGEIAFCGRLDDQIKIRGFRIEPDEIVAVLTKHPSVRECFIIARETADGEKRLVAYVACDPKAFPTHTALRGFLAAELPEYMIPDCFVQLDSLPVSTNGKIDRKALPVPNSTNLLRDNFYVAPRTAIEQRMVAIIAPLLHLDSLGVEDNFFLLGGHSLLGTQLIGRVRDAFGVELSLRMVFDASTIAQLASQIEKLLLVKIESMTEEEAREMLHAADQSHLQEHVA